MGPRGLPGEMRKNAAPHYSMFFQPLYGISAFVDELPDKPGVCLPVMVTHKHLEGIVLAAFDPIKSLDLAVRRKTTENEVAVPTNTFRDSSRTMSFTPSSAAATAAIRPAAPAPTITKSALIFSVAPILFNPPELFFTADFLYAFV